MEVITDGDSYVKVQPRIQSSVSEVESVLAAPINYENGIGTVRSYLHDLLKTLWRERGGFSGKRPFGNSGWPCDLYHALAMAGIVEAVIEDGYIDEMRKEEEEKADRLIAEAIDYVFFGCG